MAVPVITPNEIRLIIADRTQDNTLVQGVRFSNEQMEYAMEHVVDYFNLINPPIREKYTTESFPSRYLLLIGTTAHLLRMGAINEISNQLTYDSAGVSITDKDKGPAFSQLGDGLWSEFKELAGTMKMNINIGKAYGIVHSEYNNRIH